MRGRPIGDPLVEDEEIEGTEQKAEIEILLLLLVLVEVVSTGYYPVMRRIQQIQRIVLQVGCLSLSWNSTMSWSWKNFLNSS